MNLFFGDNNSDKYNVNTSIHTSSIIGKNVTSLICIYLPSKDYAHPFTFAYIQYVQTHSNP